MPRLDATLNTDRTTGQGMTDRDYATKLAELDRLLNDPTVRMDPSRVWLLMAEISAHDTALAGGARGA